MYNNRSHYYKDINIGVGLDHFPWWNDNWHYRYYIPIDKAGNVSYNINFTTLIDGLDLESYTFEQDTIHIIEYLSDGSINKIIDEFYFFKDLTKENGTIIWNVSKINDGKNYYFIYFDVVENQGIREVLTGNDNIVLTFELTDNNFKVEGWWLDEIEPINASFAFFDEFVNLSVKTVAKAENVSAFIYYTKNESINKTIYLNDVNENTEWKKDKINFSKEGNWTIRYSAYDWAGYETSVENVFYVGKPDVELVNITIFSESEFTTPKAFLNDFVNITVDVISHEATVENVNISCSIFEKGNDTALFLEEVNHSIIIDENNYVFFTWQATVAGEINVTVQIDYDDLIDESNEQNNEMTKIITIYDWPDLLIEDIIFPLTPLNERDSVNIDVVVRNIGIWDAEDYLLNLYIVKYSDNVNYYEESDIVSSSIFSIGKNSTKIVTLNWGSAKGGEWLVGAKIIINESAWDTKPRNNSMTRFDTPLKVKSIERNPPEISDVDITPNYQEQGLPVTITAIITDDTGIDYVNISIKDPDGNSIEVGKMFRKKFTEFTYTFSDTFDIGKYTVTINVRDLSVFGWTAKSSKNFTIFEDITEPVISYFDAYPNVQLKSALIEISCIASDNVKIKNVNLIIIHPNSSLPITHSMSWSNKGKYVFEGKFEKYGEYIYKIEVEDNAENFFISENKSFWITSNLNDTDNDGMPDNWEKKYDFDPFNPDDSKEDKDGDGYSNKEEYEIGNNPSKNILIENVAYRVRSNVWYLFGALILFILIFVFVMFSKRRHN